MPPVTCLGVDPAPSGRGSAVAEFKIAEGKIVPPLEKEVLTHDALRKRIGIESGECLLLAWDAPLTGPAQPNDAGGSARPYDFTTRPIERALSHKAGKPPMGISVQGYAGCQHWTITRNLLGLPRVGPYDLEHLPFTLIDRVPVQPWPLKMVVEVHPALAIWLWVTWDEVDPLRTTADLRYKKVKGREAGGKTAKEVRTGIIASLVQRWHLMGLVDVADAAEKSKALVESDDALDAFVAGLLGALLINGSAQVQICGDTCHGMFLLPAHPAVTNWFSDIGRFLR